MGTEDNNKFIGKVLIEMESIPSTNALAMELIEQSVPSHGTVILTNDQYAGRGQRGTHWSSFPGQNLTLSVILKPDFLLPQDQFLLNKSISLAVRDCVQSLVTSKVFIKWPNDILIGKKKVAGILIENSIQGKRYHYAVAGIGINVLQREFEDLPFATSIALHSQNAPLPKVILPSLFNNLESYYCILMESRHYLDELYLDNLYKKGEVTGFTEAGGCHFQGTIEGVNKFGQLLVRNIHGRDLKTYSLKEIAYI